MTVIELVGKLVKEADQLISFLHSIGDRFPEFKPTADSWVRALTASASEENQLQLATALPLEVLQIASGKIEPRSHPDNAI